VVQSRIATDIPTRRGHITEMEEAVTKPEPPRETPNCNHNRTGFHPVSGMKCLDCGALYYAEWHAAPTPEPRPDRCGAGGMVSPKGPHQRVWEYDGAFKCMDCKAQWGCLGGNPQIPATCEAGTPETPSAQRVGETLQEWIARCGPEAVEAVLKQEREKYGVSESLGETPCALSAAEFWNEWSQGMGGADVPAVPRRAVFEFADSFAADLREKLSTAERELQLIDEALARRPALDDLKTRYEKVYRACAIAGKAEAAEAKLARVKLERDAWEELAAALRTGGPDQ